MSTGALFKELRLPLERRPDTDGAIAAIMRGDITGLIPLCKNALELPAIGLSPEIAQNKKRLHDGQRRGGSGHIQNGRAGGGSAEKLSRSALRPRL